jgi:hypothetical protein
VSFGSKSLQNALDMKFEDLGEVTGLFKGSFLTISMEN